MKTTEQYNAEIAALLEMLGLAVGLPEIKTP